MSHRYGAPMGEMPTLTQAATPARLSIRKVRLNGGGYDSSGTYWGRGMPLYCVEDIDTGMRLFVRASDRATVVEQVRASFPECKVRA